MLTIEGLLATGGWSAPNFYNPYSEAEKRMGKKFCFPVNYPDFRETRTKNYPPDGFSIVTRLPKIPEFLSMDFVAEHIQKNGGSFGLCGQIALFYGAFALLGEYLHEILFRLEDHIYEFRLGNTGKVDEFRNLLLQTFGIRTDFSYKNSTELNEMVADESCALLLAFNIDFPEIGSYTHWMKYDGAIYISDINQIYQAIENKVFTPEIIKKYANCQGENTIKYAVVSGDLAPFGYTGVGTVIIPYDEFVHNVANESGQTPMINDPELAQKLLQDKHRGDGGEIMDNVAIMTKIRDKVCNHDVCD